jgi:hypothetical protein
LIAARGSGNQSRPHGVQVKRLCAPRASQLGNEDAMSAPEQPPEKVSDRLHPVVQLAAAGLLIWFVVAAWLLFGGAGYVNLALVMISVLVFMALAIPWVLWRAGVAGRRRNAELGDADETPSKTLATWLQGRFATWTDAKKPSTAAVEILLPLAAVAFGLTALGIVFQLTRAGVV